MKFSNKTTASKSNLAFNILNCKKRAEGTLTGPKSTEFSEAYFQTCQTSMLDHFCETFSIWRLWSPLEGVWYWNKRSYVLNDWTYYVPYYVRYCREYIQININFEKILIISIRRRWIMWFLSLYWNAKSLSLRLSDLWLRSQVSYKVINIHFDVFLKTFRNFIFIFLVTLSHSFQAVIINSVHWK